MLALVISQSSHVKLKRNLVIMTEKLGYLSLWQNSWLLRHDDSCDNAALHCFERCCNSSCSWFHRRQNDIHKLPCFEIDLEVPRLDTAQVITLPAKMVQAKNSFRILLKFFYTCWANTKISWSVLRLKLVTFISLK